MPVAFPIAFLLGAAVMDVIAWRSGSSERDRTALLLYRAGLITGLLASASGFLAAATLPAHSHEAHELGLWHMGVQLAALVAWRAVARAPSSASRVLALLGAALIAIGAHLAGTLVFRHGAGVAPELLRESAEGHDQHHH